MAANAGEFDRSGGAHCRDRSTDRPNGCVNERKKARGVVDGWMEDFL